MPFRIYCYTFFFLDPTFDRSLKRAITIFINIICACAMSCLCYSLQQVLTGIVLLLWRLPATISTSPPSIWLAHWIYIAILFSSRSFVAVDVTWNFCNCISATTHLHENWLRQKSNDGERARAYTHDYDLYLKSHSMYLFVCWFFFCFLAMDNQHFDGKSAIAMNITASASTNGQLFGITVQKRQNKLIYGLFYTCRAKKCLHITHACI